MFRILRAIKGHLAAVARTLDPDTLTVDQAAQAIQLLAAIEKAAAGLRLLLARRVDNASLFGQTGERSAAEWLAKQTGQSTRDAEEDLACSKRLRELPDAQDAVRNGELSSDQAKAVADGAAADPSAEQELLDTARRGSLGELSRQSKSRKAAALGDDDARRKAAHRNRSFRSGTSVTGEGWGRFTGPAEFVVRLQAHLKPYLDAEFARARAEGRRERADAYAYDALAAMLGLSDSPVASAGATPHRATDPAAPTSPAEARGAPPTAAPDASPTRPETPAPGFAGGGADVGGPTTGGGPGSPGSGSGSSPVASPSAGAPAFGDQPAKAGRSPLDWAKIRVTELANLDWLCPHCHRLKTYDGWRFEPGTGKRALLPPAEQWWLDDGDAVTAGSGPPGDPPESHAA